METFLIRALQLIMSLSLLVIIHEGGHFLFARLFKTRVEKFCLFFDPWFTLFKFKPKHSDTEYGIGWLPLGGYVKIAGMIDESMDTEQMKQPMQPWEFRAKPAWQRLLIMVGGVLFNFLLALFIYSMILFTWGDEYVPVQKAPLGMDFNKTAKNIGFRDGDVLVSADGTPFERYDGDLLTNVVDARQVTVLRGGQEASVYIPEDMMEKLLADSVRFASFRFPFVIDSISAGRPAALAGLQAGDSITALDGKVISYFDFKEEMMNRRKTGSASHDITLAYVRNGVADTLTLTTDSLYEIGIAARTATDKLLPVIRKNYSFLSSFPAGVALGVKTLKGYIGQMKYLFSKEGAKQLGGFGTIGSIFPATWDWHQFWYMTAFLSIILAFMNILPIPALDGGHVLFLIYEIVARRKPSDKFMERAQMVGMFLLFGLLLWANFNDILRFLF
ncbi:RIP metalloprotease RseP [Bacteroides helcogenes]|uniref:Zinc metalloprotease n=1 Tax=Bacteroides helcogenes (strain ATCC 35417 / DSM 20613 / JCM 6297 / CCUG 15421 / P 36-108) TaxID=693979 RepID=E6SRQ5_BACT6|nr:RIP metalloprotease RseP [Bacteroides helcogenes]ADV45145.1 site-2 protease [Bacteroides helcogenes P 36-108]MDY5238704.1 RIP metalloprotease RseP [Bacteroides helcogenes]